MCNLTLSTVVSCPQAVYCCVLPRCCSGITAQTSYAQQSPMDSEQRPETKRPILAGMTCKCACRRETKRRKRRKAETDGDHGYGNKAWAQAPGPSGRAHEFDVRFSSRPLDQRCGNRNGTVACEPRSRLAGASESESRWGRWRARAAP